jgi:hypothetical protein
VDREYRQPDISLGTMTYTDGGGLNLLTTGNRAYFDSTNPSAVGTGTSSISFPNINLAGVPPPPESTQDFRGSNHL